MFEVPNAGEDHGQAVFVRGGDYFVVADGASRLDHRGDAVFGGFVEAVASALVESGLPPAHVKTERFGPTGG